jgi:hypothetical protein
MARRAIVHADNIILDVEAVAGPAPRRLMYTVAPFTVLIGRLFNSSSG